MLYLFERIANVIEEAGLFVEEIIAIAQDPTSWPGAGSSEEDEPGETAEAGALERTGESEEADESEEVAEADVMGENPERGETDETSDFNGWLQERALEALSIPILTVDPEDVLAGICEEEGTVK